MPRRLATIGSKLTCERYAVIAAEMRSAENIPAAADRLAAAMAEVAWEMRQSTSYILLVFTLVKALVDAVVEFLANHVDG